MVRFKVSLISIANHSLISKKCQNRWILVEFIPVVQDQGAQLGKLPISNGRPLDGKAIWAALKQSVLVNFGDTGWGAVGLSLTGASSGWYE